MKKIKVVDFIKTLEEICFDDETELVFDTLDGTTGEPYDLELNEFYFGDALCVPNVNEINIEFMVSDEFIKAKSSELVSDLAEEIRDVINKYR
ncbi:MAG: hypothetical protein K0S18_27 [Anaerocolumna sp.]|jgi:hypothetical protein|nr:hypothetical protein [Anaerocolumna sp.]